MMILKNQKDIIDVNSSFPAETIDDIQDVYSPAIKLPFYKTYTDKDKSITSYLLDNYCEFILLFIPTFLLL